ncbi:hypothetical protein Ct61P_14518 [Colletotrichum tofieldiae]|nr:hypothetical protein Ct61P_14518 [Colletotrichum tofieldiae]
MSDQKKQNDVINQYQFYQFPTSSNIGDWASGVASTIKSHQAAAIEHHSRRHASGISRALRDHGIKTKRNDDRVQEHLHYLREHWPNACWHPSSFPPTKSPSPFDVLTPLVTITKVWLEHRPSQSLNDLWCDSPDPMERGVIVQAIRAKPRARLTKITASAALALAKAHLDALPAAASKPPQLSLPVQEEAKESSAEERRCFRREKHAAEAAEPEAVAAREGLDSDEAEEIATDLTDVAAMAVAERAKEKYGHLLPAHKRGVITRKSWPSARKGVLSSV